MRLRCFSFTAALLAVAAPLPSRAQPSPPEASGGPRPEGSESAAPNDAPDRDAPTDESDSPPRADDSDDGSSAHGEAPSVRPPELLVAVAPRFPRSAVPQRQTGSVVLELTVSAEGRVVAARVHRGLGPDFDAAALEAAEHLVFRPAERGGQSVAVRILHAMEFVPPADDPSSENDATRTPDEAPLPASTGDSTPASSVEPEANPEDTTPLEVVVLGPSLVDRLRRSAHAVQVVDLTEQKQRSADLGDVLVRSTSLNAQRQGGLGSQGRYGLAGLGGDRVRFFLDGVPLELSGYAFGVANVPVGAVDRVEVYQGVVPTRFGADALGGAVNLVTDDDVRSDRATASYQFGSFDTHRLTATARRYLPEHNLFVRGSAFFDRSSNDYPVDVEVSDDSGQLTPARLRRFHDGYRGLGGHLAFGVVDVPYADRWSLQGFFADYDRDVQNNVNMTVPYGEVTFQRRTYGASTRYAKRFSDALRVDATLGHAYRGSHFQDLSRCRYDWYGRCFLELPLSGEIDAVPIDRRVDEHSFYGRGQLSWSVAPEHTLRLVVAPTAGLRSGRDAALAEDRYDPLRARRAMTTSVVGLEHEASAWDDQLANVAFLKLYQQHARSREQKATGHIEPVTASELTAGAGESLRVNLAEAIYVKASYEYAARLPSIDERFGDGGLVVQNLGLRPERSHNGNLGVYVEGLRTPMGQLRARVDGALRFVDDLIVLLGTGAYFEYSNVLSARGFGLDAGAGWSAPGDWVGVDVRVNYHDLRNVSTAGPGARFNGDRIPHQPYLQLFGSAYLRKRGLLDDSDTVDVHWNVRRVEEFFLGWESAGSSGATKLTVPDQTVHTLGVTHVLAGTDVTLSNGFEVQNLTDARVYDLYGVQRPGRAFFWKLTVDHR